MVTILDVMQMKRNGDIEGLTGALLDPDIAVRAEAASSLGSLGDRTAVEPLVSCLRDDSDPYVRSLAAEALGDLGDPNARVVLLDALASDTMEVSMSAAKALGSLP